MATDTSAPYAPKLVLRGTWLDTPEVTMQTSKGTVVFELAPAAAPYTVANFLAYANGGFYSAQEFDLGPFESIRAQVLELGRACVHIEHRNLQVLSLLWRGIADYARERGCRYLLGCSSLTSQDPEEGLALYQMLSQRHLAPEFFRTVPLPGWACPEPLQQSEPAPVPRAPKLLTAYLSLGAKICAPPAMDREFKTIDFLTLLDLENLPSRAAALIG